jgi:hypothetical protein
MGLADFCWTPTLFLRNFGHEGGPKNGQKNFSEKG